MGTRTGLTIGLPHPPTDRALRVLTLLVLCVQVGGLTVWMKARPWELHYRRALHHAQLARNIAEGKGITTSALWPSDLTPGKRPRSQPDLRVAPAHPLVLAVAFAAASPSVRVVLIVALCFQLLTLALLMRLGTRLFGIWIATVALTVYALSPSTLQMIAAGGEAPMLSALIAWWLVRLDRATRWANGEDRNITFGAGAGLGAISGLACLTHYHCLMLPLALLALPVRRRFRFCCALAAGWLLVVTPWTVRNWRVTGKPALTTFGRELLTYTSRHPGTTLFRDTPRHRRLPLWDAILEPFELTVKATRSLGTVPWRLAGGGLNALLVFLCFGLLTPFAFEEQNLMRGIVWWLVGVGVTAFAVGRRDPTLLCAASPVCAIVAVAHFSQLLHRIPTHDHAVAVGPVEFDWDRLTVHGIALVALLVLGVAPLASHTLSSSQMERRAPRDRTLEFLRRFARMGEAGQGVVITDAPEWVAWSSGRVALWLPETRTVAAATSRGGESKRTQADGIDAIVLTKDLLAYPVDERVDAWKRMYLGLSRPEGFVRIAGRPGETVVFVKAPAAANGRR